MSLPDETPVAELKARYEVESMQLFGGVAFKYTESYTDDPIAAAELAKACAREADVVTTSGPGTGKSAGVAKVSAMKMVLGDRPLALASGVSIENIDSYRPYVDAVLAASSIETFSDSGVFVDEKLRELVQSAHQS